MFAQTSLFDLSCPIKAISRLMLSTSLSLVHAFDGQ